jgi:site-specific recombinase XerD
VHALTCADVDLHSGPVTGREGKGGKARAVPFSRHTKRALYHLTRHGLTFLLRHSFLRAGRNVFTLQQMLGHTHLAMTDRCVAVAQADTQRINIACSRRWRG